MVHTLLRSSPWFLVLFAASLGTAGCFNSPINRSPVVTMIDADGVPLRGGAVTYTAHGYDPDQDQITWTWATGAYPCPNPSDPGAWPLGPKPQSPSPTTFPIASVTTAECVWVFATDRYGATTADNTPLVPADNPPVAVIRVASPSPADSYPAYSRFRLSSASSSDADPGDPLYPTWSIDQAPLGSTATLAPCPASDPATAADPTLQCLDVLVSGQYVVSLTVSDGFMSTTTSMTLKVLDDALPCITMTTHDYNDPTYKDDPTMPNPIVVKMVSDDGDPFPNPNNQLDTVKFTWFKGKNDGPLQYVDNGGFSELDLIPMDYQIGDVANVRLEIHDRNTAAIDAILSDCGDQPRCPIAAGSSCFLRVSWRVEMDL